jgi:hypothetical protein
MKAISISEIKQELSDLPQSKLLELCLKLAKYKKDNKEFLTYLLFSNNDTEEYIDSIKAVIHNLFTEMNTTNLYFIKKSLRKILRVTNKYIKYTSSKQIEAELLIYFCTTIKSFKIPIDKSTALSNLYNTQVKKINDAIATLHEDLQYDYKKYLQVL